MSQPAETTQAAQPSVSGRLRRTSTAGLRLLRGYLIGALIVAGVVLALGATNLGGALNAEQTTGALAIGGAALLAALIGLGAAWRRKRRLAALALVVWALISVIGGAWLVPEERTLWPALAVLPAIAAVLALSWYSAAGSTALALAGVWIVNLVVLPAPSAAEQWTMLLLSAAALGLAALLAGATAFIGTVEHRMEDSHARSASLSDQVNSEQAAKARVIDELSLERDRLMAILEAAPAGVILAEGDGSVVSANQAARALLPTSEQQPIEGSRLSQWTAAIPERSAILDASAQGERKTTRIELLGAPRRVLRIEEAPLATPGGRALGTVAFIQDDTASIDFQRQQTQFLDLLVKDMHDPLLSVQAAHDTLLGVDLGPNNERVLTTARRTTAKVVDLVQTLREMQRLQQEPGQLHRVQGPLRPLIEAAVAQITPAAQQRTITIVVEHGSDLGSLALDAERLRKALLALLENALQHSPAYSTLRIQTQLLNSAVQLRIIDQGPGLDAEQIARLFDRLGRTTDGRQGLGLAYAKLVVEAHGGRIWVDSTPGKGTTFTLHLPA